MIAFKDLLLGLLIAHILAAYFYICGSLLRTLTHGFQRAEVPADGSALVEIIIDVAAGMALTGLLTFALGVLHAIYPATFAAWIVLLVGAFIWAGDSPLSKPFWVSRARVWRSAISWPSIFLYSIALVIAVPAYLPDTGSDATAYHLPYALDWATAHALVVDRWLRFPYYANNWTLIDAWMIEYGLANFIPFLSWLAACLIMLGIYAAVAVFGGSTRTQIRVIRAAGVAAALGFALNPTFLKVAVTAMLDAPIAFVFCSSVLALMTALRERRVSLLWQASICAAFFIGTKASYIFFLPLFATALYFVAVNASVSAKKIAVLLAIFACFSAPWFVRNFILAGDPIAPTLNLALHGVDVKWSTADMRDLMGDLKTDSSPMALLQLPISMFADPMSRDIRTPGTTLLVVFLFLPGIALTWLWVRGRLRAEPVAALCAIILLYSIGYWNGTSHYARYALLFLPILAVFVAVLAIRTFKAHLRWTPVLVMLAAMLPSPAAAQWYTHMISDDYINEWTWYQGHDEWLMPRCAAYPELNYIASSLKDRRVSGGVVYAVQADYMQLYFKQHGLTLIGDAFGPERYVDFAYAIRSNDIASYTARFKVSAFMVPTPEMLLTSPRGFNYDDLDKLAGELRALHFKRVLLPNARYVVYMAP